jgi:DNA helicase INO80
MRAKKLTREMMNFWKKRDKEMADIKRKKEKVEKEIRRKQEEEKEALLQKKRLEFIMKQSEIYAHFMSKKLGLAEEQQK